MGIAEVIPGVSGGTIAFITGIYKTLLDSIKSVDGEFLQLLSKFKLGAVWQKINGPFLLWLFGGMIGGVIIGVFGVTYFLENYPEVLWALFFGLILGSVPMMLSQIRSVDIKSIALFIIGTIFAFGITSLNPMSGSENYLFIYVAGVIAISALVLPGISGSFMLLLMGLYSTIIPTIKSFLKSPELSEFILLAVFGLGILTGLVLFSRLVSAAFEKYHDGTIALMSGFMLGSLNKIWPWRNIETILDKRTHDLVSVSPETIANIDLTADYVKVVKEKNVFPGEYFSDSNLLPVALAFALGLAMMLIIHKSGLMKNGMEE